MVFHRIKKKLVNKKLKIEVYDYKLTVNLTVKSDKEKRLEKVEKKYKNGESLDIEDLIFLQKNDKL